MNNLKVVKPDEEAPQFGVEDALRLKETFDSLENDIDKWKFLMQIKDYVVIIVEENHTSIEYRDPGELATALYDPKDKQVLHSVFSDTLGMKNGAYNLLKALGCNVI